MIVCAIDIGTTATKGMLVDATGKILGEASTQYPMTNTADGCAEQDPGLVVEAAFGVAATLCKARQAGEVVALSLSAAMHSLILLDAKCRPLTASMTWADRRAASMAAALRQSAEGVAMYRRTGTPIHPMAWPAKLAYLREHDATLFKRARHLIGIKELFMLRLTGLIVCDRSIASATGLYQLASGTWDDGAMAFAGVDSGQLPDLCATTTQFKITSTAASELGLAPDTPVVIGAGDGCLSNLGAGAIAHGHAALTIGTSAALRCVFESPRTDPQMRTFCYVLTEDRFVCGGASNNGGIALQWARDELARTERASADLPGGDAYAALARLAASVPAGSEGLMFHPYLSGERAPLWNPEARASFIGLTLAHRKEHMIRAVMEGVLMNLFMVLAAIEAANAPVTRILAVGGFATSAFWRQMLADVFGREIEFPRNSESSGLGAARLAFYALGANASLDDFIAKPGEGEVLRPERQAAAAYREMHAIFDRVPVLLEPIYLALSESPAKVDDDARRELSR